MSAFKRYIPLAPVLVAMTVIVCGAFLIGSIIDSGLNCLSRVSRETKNPCVADVSEGLFR